MSTNSSNFQIFPDKGEVWEVVPFEHCGPIRGNVPVDEIVSLFGPPTNITPYIWYQNSTQFHWSNLRILALEDGGVARVHSVDVPVSQKCRAFGIALHGSVTKLALKFKEIGHIATEGYDGCTLGSGLAVSTMAGRKRIEQVNVVLGRTQPEPAIISNEAVEDLIAKRIAEA